MLDFLEAEEESYLPYILQLILQLRHLFQQLPRTEFYSYSIHSCLYGQDSISLRVAIFSESHGDENIDPMDSLHPFLIVPP